VRVQHNPTYAKRPSRHVWLFMLAIAQR